MTLKQGATLITLRGELDSGDDGDRITPAGTVGIVSRVYTEQAECYAVDFPATGASIFLTNDEANDPNQYRLLDGPEAELAALRCKARLYNEKHIDGPEEVPTGEHYNDLLALIGV